MEPTIQAGDNILVSKSTMGARLFNIFEALGEKQTTIYRTPGFRKIEHNDVVVFNFPYPKEDKIEMHILKYYIKRCIGLPGDMLSIENGEFLIDGTPGLVGNPVSQQKITQMQEEEFGEGVYYTFPFDSILRWTIKDFGPLYIPQKGDYITLDRNHYLLYRKLIEWETGQQLTFEVDGVYLNGEKRGSYQFQKDYYFMAGDKGENSQDSRYWGLLPEEYIVGKAWIIWKSIDPYTGELQWQRFMKKI